MVRLPVSAMPWHKDDCGVLVVCDDGSVWRWSEGTGLWTRVAGLPGSSAERYALTGDLRPTDVKRRMDRQREHDESTS